MYKVKYKLVEELCSGFTIQLRQSYKHCITLFIYLKIYKIIRIQYIIVHITKNIQFEETNPLSLTRPQDQVFQAIKLSKTRLYREKLHQ